MDLKWLLRARKAYGAFEKRAPVPLTIGDEKKLNSCGSMSNSLLAWEGLHLRP